MFESNCQKADLWMAEFSADRLDLSNGLRLQDHLSHCDSCRRRSTRISAIVSLLQNDSPTLNKKRFAAIEQTLRAAPTGSQHPAQMSKRTRNLLVAALLLLAPVALAWVQIQKGVLLTHPSPSTPNHVLSAIPVSQNTPKSISTKPQTIHGGVLKTLEEQPFELTINSNGEIRLYPYTQTGNPVLTSSVQKPGVSFSFEEKVYRVKLSEDNEQIYFIGQLSTDHPKISPELFELYSIKNTAAPGMFYPPKRIVLPSLFKKSSSPNQPLFRIQKRENNREKIRLLPKKKGKK